MDNYTFILAITLLLLLILLPYRHNIENFVNSITDSNFKNIEKVTARVDNAEYYVQADYKNKEEAANMVAELNNIMLHFIQYLKKKYPSSAKIQRLAIRYNPKQIIEGNPINDKNSTSYSVAKGKKVVLCIRSKKNKKIHDRNLLIFVNIHELAHIMSVSFGHNAEFTNNFRFLLQEAINMGIYKKMNFYLNPQEYCGMTVSTSPI